MPKLLSISLTTFMLLASVLALPLQAAAKEVLLGTSTWIGYAPFYVAVEMKLFERNGIKVRLKDYPDPTLMPSAVSHGSIQGAMYTYDQVLSSNAHGQKHKVVMPIDYSNGADALIADKSIKSIMDLKGKKVAYPFSTCDNLLVVYALNKAGMKESDIHAMNTTPESVPSALQGGALAGASYEPTITQILKMGDGKKYHTLVTSKEAPGLITDVLYFDQTYINKNPDTVRAVIKGYLDGLKFIKDNPTESQKMISKFMHSSEQEVSLQQNGVYNIPATEMARYFTKHSDAKSLYTVAGMINDILIKRGQIKLAASTEDTFDSRFANELKAMR